MPLAKELNVPVIALSQLSRAHGEKGRSGRPSSPTCESRAPWSRTPTWWRSSIAKRSNKQNEPKDNSDVIIAKQRNGPTDRFTLGWSGEYTRFSDLAMMSEGPGL